MLKKKLLQITWTPMVSENTDGITTRSICWASRTPKLFSAHPDTAEDRPANPQRHKQCSDCQAGLQCDVVEDAVHFRVFRQEAFRDGKDLGEYSKGNELKAEEEPKRTRREEYEHRIRRH